ncbi:hypothetical protein L1S32_00535 [Methanogenium sp. S4BF]|uniref:hypothetical protein n=1 Tax=Methanogenium sp. S4BF TaxID=1789226 RepID=UPI0024162B38|nr:hypothetical protein [Methanogenium sp. S4BF]WFN34642.1 hypothetical protein L1S32_00535 [Methanogenium sp. S4BF]
MAPKTSSFIFCAACICAAICGAGCLASPGPQEMVPPQAGEPDSIIPFQVAEADAEETLTRLIEEEIAQNPALAGYTVQDFYNDTPLVAVESSSYQPGDGARPYSVYTFRHTMPSLKDPQHTMDDVTLQITVADGKITERLVSMGSSVTVTGV